MSFVVKVLYDDVPDKPRWVMAGTGRGLVARENATEYLSRAEADEESKIWMALPVKGLSAIVEPA
jgi:hypothetical protein